MTAPIDGVLLLTSSRSSVGVTSVRLRNLWHQELEAAQEREAV